MISFVCPKCDTELEVSDSRAGASVTCAECGQKIKVPAAPSRGNKSRNDDQARSRPSKPVPRPSRRRDDGERPKKRSQRGTGAGVWIAVGAGVFVLLVAGAVGAFFALRGDKSDTKPNSNQSAQKAGGADRQRETKPADAAADRQEAPPDTAAPAPDLAHSGAPSRDKIAKRLLKSTVWIVGIKDGHPTASGSGTVVDRANGLVLTNYHMVMDNLESMAIFLPEYRNGELISERTHYTSKLARNEFNAGKAVATDPTRDLALVQLRAPIPAGYMGLRFADAVPTQGSDVHSMGSPGASGALWLYTKGNVRSNVYLHEWKAGSADGSSVLDLKAKVIETDSATNPGDSGGPLVNNRAELVAIVQGGSRQANSISLFIAASEARDLIETHFKKINKTWVMEAAETDLSAESGEGGAEIVGLIKGLEHKDATVRAQAASNLGSKGGKAQIAVASLIKASKDPDALVRRMSVEALEKIGPPAKVDVPDLIKALKDPAPEIKQYALRSLATMGPDARPAVPALVEASQDLTNKQFRTGVLLALGKTGGDERDTVFPILLAALREPDRDIRAAAGTALTSLGKPVATELPSLTEALADAKPEVRGVAAGLLGELGPAARAAVPRLADLLGQSDASNRIAAAQALGKIGADAREAVPKLLKAIDNEDGQLSKAAAEGLARVGGLSATETASLTNLLKSPRPHVRVSALVALGKMPEAKSSLSSFTSALKDSDKNVRLQAVMVFGSLATLPTEGIDALAEVLKDSDVDLRKAVLAVLIKVGAGAKKAGPALEPIIKDKEGDREVLALALQLMAVIGPDGRLAGNVADLLQAKSEPALRTKAFSVLTKMGKPAVAPLVRVLNDKEDKDLRVGAAKALGEMGADARPAIAAAGGLQAHATSDTEKDVRDAATAAMDKISKAR